MNVRSSRAALLPAAAALALAIAGMPAPAAAQMGGLGSINPFGAFAENIARVTALNDPSAVRQLLADGHSPNDVDDQGRAGLEIAASKGNLQIAQMLIKGGAKLDARDQLGDTALHAAARQDQIEIVKLLLDAGAPVDPQNRDGMTPLMIAASRGELEIVRALLAKGASVTKADFTGRDAASWAEDSRRPAVERAIARAGTR